MGLRKSTLLCLLPFCVAILLSGLHAQSAASISAPLSTLATSRIAANIDNSSLQILPGNHHPQARPEFETGAVAADLSMQNLVLVLESSKEQQTALDALLIAQRDPASTYYHQWLTPAQYADYFGVSTEDIQRISNWLQSYGMRVDEVAASHRSITFSGTASQVERAFSTSMRSYRVNGAAHIANAVDPSIPSGFAPVVSGVLSLHDFQLRAMHSALRNPVTEVTFGNAHYITPGDLAVIYNVNPLYTQGVDGSGQSVAVVARSNIKMSDVQSFRSAFGLPVNDPQVIVNGAVDPGTSNPSELTEATLDAEYAGALARKAAVKFVTSASTATSDGIYLSAQYIVNQNLAPVMTTSFGSCEASMGAAENAFINALWQQAAAQGITVLVSAGDSGAAGCDSASSATAQYGPGVNGLCSTPYELCVGGTKLNDTGNPSQYWAANNASATEASALSYIPEVAWNESGPTLGLWASGGGRSTVYNKPAWQTCSGVPADGKRDVPDLSLTAAGHDGYMIVMNGMQFIVGGTSASTPAMASILALVVQSTGVRQGLANPTLYALAARQSNAGASVFHDVSSGSNTVPGVTGFSATAGYDLVSGLGSVDASALVSHWRDGQSTPAIQITLNSNALTLPLSSSAPVAVMVAGQGGLSSAVALTASGLPRGISATFTNATIAAPGSGRSTVQVAVAPTVAAGSYTFNVVATSGSVTSSAAVSVTVLAPAFTLASSATLLTMPAGTRQTITVTAAGNAAFNSAVTLKVTGLPAGITGTFSPASITAPGSGSSVLTFASTTGVQPGSYIATITATAGTLSKTVQCALNLPSLSASASATSLSFAQGTSGALTLTTKSAGGFNSAVAIAITGLPSGVTATLTPTSIAAPGAGAVFIKFTASGTAVLGSARATITVSGGGLATSVPLSVTITSAPTFSLGPASSAKVKIGTSTVVKLTSSEQNGFSSLLSLTASGAPAGVTLKLSATTIAPGHGISLTITSTTSTAIGSATVIVTASGGGQSKSAAIPLTFSK